MFGIGGNKKGNFVFIDSQNLMQSLKDQAWKLDHKKFVSYLEENYDAETIYYFIPYNKDNHHIYTMLKEAGYTVVLKQAVRMPDGTTKANVDTDLVLQIMIDFENYDKAIVITGDGDFASTVKYLNSKNKLEKVIVPDSSKFSVLLKEASGNKVGYMDLIKKEVGIKGQNEGGLFNMIGKIFK